LAVVADLKSHSLEIAVRRIVPVDLMAIFQIKAAEATIDRSEELRREVCSFVDIAFDSGRFDRMYINFPKHNLSALKKLLRPLTLSHGRKFAMVEFASLEPRLSDTLRPLFAEEIIFYEQLSSILKACLMG